jgi:hypothetical protein
MGSLKSMPKQIHRVLATFTLLATLVVGKAAPANAEAWRLSVKGGEIDLGETPLLHELKLPLPVGVYSLEPVGGSGGEPNWAQVFEASEGRGLLLGTVLRSVPARATAAYALKGPVTKSAAHDTGLSLEPTGQNIKVLIDRQLFTEYRFDSGNKPYFYPLIGPTGHSFTRTYPMEILPDEDHDHPHQRSCWFTHGNVDGVDFWSEGKRFGIIKETSRSISAAGPIVARISTKNEWRGIDDLKRCEDDRTVTFYRTKNARIIDFDFRIRATEGPVTFFDTKEGTFGLRVASTMDVTKKLGGTIVNAEGLKNEKAWGKPSIWVDYTGPVKGQLVGITVINHPRSFRYPTTWHVRTYGLFAANPFGWHDFGRPERGDCTIPGDRSIEFGYRVVLHEGDTRAANVEALAAGYISPLAVEIQKD